ncbi:cofactor-independent phosphoglycerate mutase [bacterium]|nr:cofactor-independent phosphoglycerate mutase [bacterium]
MKYIIVVPDGMSDLPLKELDGKTPLEFAKTPNMDFLAHNGVVGKVNNVPKGMVPASDVANLCLLGYNPKKFYTGRGPFEARSAGIELKDTEVAFRCNTVTVHDGIMSDYSAGHISTKEAAILIGHVDGMLGSDAVSFYPGVSYRHIMVVDTKKAGFDFENLKCMPPHDILHQEIKKNMPKGKGADFIIDLMNKSACILENHDINRIRVDLGENPGNMIWLWGQGAKPKLDKFYDKFKLKGALISAVGLLKGIGLTIGIDAIDVPGITGYYDTDYNAKAVYGIKALEDHDFLFLHIESPDEAGHNGDLDEKIKAIENVDEKIIGKIINEWGKNKDYRILVLPDHPTPVSVQTHTADDVPFVMYGKGIGKNEVDVYSEKAVIDKRAKVYKYGFELVYDFLMKEQI